MRPTSQQFRLLVLSGRLRPFAVPVYRLEMVALCLQCEVNTCIPCPIKEKPAPSLHITPQRTLLGSLTSRQGRGTHFEWLIYEICKQDARSYRLIIRPWFHLHDPLPEFH